MPHLTTHVLDTLHGRPASGLWVELWKDETLVLATHTNPEGRCESPLLEGETLVPGTYELRFHVAEYFAALGTACPFLDVVPVRFRVEAGQSYHVPLVCSPWAYSTYRGS